MCDDRRIPVLRRRQIVQSFSRLPKYMCYTLNWKGNQEMSAYHEYPPLFDFSMFITWKISRLVSLDRYVADVGFHHVDSLDAGAKHTVILEPNGNYEYSIEQKGSVALPAPYDTNCVDYKLLGTHRFYPAYMTQTLCMEECRMNITFLNCGCIMKTYPFRNKLDQVMCDDMQTADCVLKRSKAIYDRVCREACRNPCEETTYDITLGYQSRESGIPFNGYYYLNMKLTIPVRYVAILKTIPMYTSTTVLAVIGGYLGFWLGLSMYSGVTKILFRIQAIIAKRTKDPLNKASLACLFRSVRLLCQAVCAAFCVVQARTDILQYESYPTAVMYGYDRMAGIQFPAVTLCMEKGYNMTRLCSEHSFMDCSDNDSQRIVGAYLTVTVKLIEYSYARKDVIFDCKFVSGDAACQDFDCAELWQPSYTLAFETVCHTFDLARNRTSPYWDCPSPWKYKMLASVSARSERAHNETVFLMGHFHQQNVIGNGERSTMKFRAGYKYKIATYQTDSRSLPYPYETMCSDYVTLSKKLGYQHYIMQSEECSENCLMEHWLQNCHCSSKLYGLRHERHRDLCDIFDHVQCTHLMKVGQWRPKCLASCTQPCHEIRYKTYSNVVGKIKKNASRLNAVELVIQMGSDRRKTVSGYPRMEIPGLITYVEGHIGMWLGLSILAISSAIVKFHQKVIQHLFSTD
ncbi:uncharacterized protein LOC142803690 [Rhipicephalus microplus]|uniref:uncharacterized protein LOC142803690 n=1 Tax=Rhipicephalus microplus TaxID=6941 RepID=UPI003F6C3CFC